MARARHAHWKQAGTAGLVAVAAVLLLHATTDVLARADRWLYDACVATARRPPAADTVVLDTTAADTVPPTAQQADALAELTARLSQAGAALVVLALPEFADDAEAQLARSLHDSGRVVLAWTGQPPPDALARNALASAETALATDVDGVLRSQRLFAGSEGQGAPVAALVVAAQRLGVPLSQLRRIAGRGAQLGPLELPTQDDGSVRPHFYRDASDGTPPFALAAPRDAVDATRWAGRIVFVGPRTDARAPRLVTAGGHAVAPVEALAHMASALSQQHVVVRPAWAHGVVALLGAAVAALLIWRLPAAPAATRFALAAALTVALAAAQWLLPLAAGWWLPLVLPAAVLWVGVALLSVWPRAPVSAVRRAAPQRGDAPAPRQAAGAPPRDERRRLGRFVVERELGRGAIGTVYLARDPLDGQAVAIKTLALGGAAGDAALDEARRRFVRESETARRLRHPDIVKVLDAGETRELAWIAMEYVPGRDLARHAHAGTLLPVAVVVRVVARIAAALAHAHRQGVVHRDVKPANVLIDTATDTVKVTDFGVSHVADASRTRTGLVLGTPSFMSPEQLAGDVVDGRSDLYSLGVTLFQLLTGRLPHEADSPARLMAQIANDAAPDVRRWRPELPEALARIVARALEKRPAARYAEGDQMACELRAVEAQLAQAGRAERAGVGAMPP